MSLALTLAAAFLFVGPNQQPSAVQPSTSNLQPSLVTNRVATLPASAPRLSNPAVRVVNLAAATPALRADCGYYTLLNDEPPAAPTATNYYERVGYAINAPTAAVPTYSTIWASRSITPAPTRYSKLKIITAAKSLGKWAALKAWIEAAGYYDEWLVAQYLSSDYDGFDRITAAIVAADIMTADELAAILAASVDSEL